MRKSIMHIPNNVSNTCNFDGLSLYHYTKTAEHPSEADYYKGVLVDNTTEEEIARSFQWAPTVVGNITPVDKIYSPLYECVVLRFWSFGGKKGISTHRNPNIVGTKSHIDVGRPFMELIQEAIGGFGYTRSEYIVDEERGLKGLNMVPTSWEDLCVEGWCHVFLLVDTSTQITDLTDLTEESFLIHETGEEVYSPKHIAPKLLHALSLSQQQDEDGIMRLIPTTLEIVIDRSGTDEYAQHRMIVPTVQQLSHQEADQILINGGAVIGFDPLMPDVTTKYISPEYQRKLELVGDTFNIVHRCHELKDKNPDDIEEYLDAIPLHKKGMSIIEINDLFEQYTLETSAFMYNIVNGRLSGKLNDYDESLRNYGKNPQHKQPRINKGAGIDILRDIINIAHTDTGRKLTRKKMSDEEMRKNIYNIIDTRLSALSNVKRHAVHGIMDKIVRGFQGY